MIRKEQERTAMLMGEEALTRLAEARVAVFGLGGVGGYALEGLVRTGVGAVDLIDDDRVAASNLNRQIIATRETVGMDKTDAAERRVLAIDPSVTVRKHKCFYLPERAGEFDFSAYDYVVDAVDTVTAKLDIIERCVKEGVPVISAMGCGNRLDPGKLAVKDLADTSGDPLARVMRRELRKRGIWHVTVVCSSEEALTPLFQPEKEEGSSRRSTPGSVAFVPACAGMMLAAHVCRELARPDGARGKRT